MASDIDEKELEQVDGREPTGRDDWAIDIVDLIENIIILNSEFEVVVYWNRSDLSSK